MGFTATRSAGVGVSIVFFDRRRVTVHRSPGRFLCRAQAWPAWPYASHSGYEPVALWHTVPFRSLAVVLGSPLQREASARLLVDRALIRGRLWCFSGYQCSSLDQRTVPLVGPWYRTVPLIDERWVSSVSIIYRAFGLLFSPHRRIFRWTHIRSTSAYRSRLCSASTVVVWRIFPAVFALVSKESHLGRGRGDLAIGRVWLEEPSGDRSGSYRHYEHIDPHPYGYLCDGARGSTRLYERRGPAFIPSPGFSLL